MIVIGDVHGCYDKLMYLMEKLPYTDNICFVGDLIDRGPDSKKVVDFVIENNYNSVLGNHEEFVNLAFQPNDNGELIINREIYEIWLRNGGNQTLKSFGDSFFEYLDFFKNLPLYIIHKHFMISHSYANNGTKTDKDELLWHRQFWMPMGEDYINIFGHTIQWNGPVKFQYKHWCIDTGCFVTGNLTAVDLKTITFYSTVGK